MPHHVFNCKMAYSMNAACESADFTLCAISPSCSCRNTPPKGCTFSQINSYHYILWCYNYEDTEPRIVIIKKYQYDTIRKHT